MCTFLNVYMLDQINYTNTGDYSVLQDVSTFFPPRCSVIPFRNCACNCACAYFNICLIIYFFGNTNESNHRPPTKFILLSWNYIAYIIYNIAILFPLLPGQLLPVVLPTYSNSHWSNVDTARTPRCVKLQRNGIARDLYHICVIGFDSIQITFGLIDHHFSQTTVFFCVSLSPIQHGFVPAKRP